MSSIIKSKQPQPFYQRCFFALLAMLLLALCCSFWVEYERDYWKILASVKLTAAVVEETEFLYLKPTFPPKIKRLAGKQITLEGYLRYLGPKGFILTKYRSSRGQLRSLGPGPKEMVALKLSPLVDYKNSSFVKIEGKLKLNHNHPAAPIYSLEDADCVNCRMIKLKTVGN